MSGRDPSTWILREAGRGATAAESTFASRAKNWSLAFIVLLVAGACHGSGGRPTLPCAGIIRTGSKGVVSPTCMQEGPLALAEVYANERWRPGDAAAARDPFRRRISR